MISAYARLLALGRELQLVNDSAALLGWDQEVLLPPRGIAYRAEQMSWFSGYVHERFTSAEVGEWIAGAESELAADDPVAAANLRGPATSSATSPPGDIRGLDRGAAALRRRRPAGSPPSRRPRGSRRHARPGEPCPELGPGLASHEVGPGLVALN